MTTVSYVTVGVYQRQIPRMNLNVILWELNVKTILLFIFEVAIVIEILDFVLKICKKTIRKI